jgi:hypothetical protein
MTELAGKFCPVKPVIKNYRGDTGLSGMIIQEYRSIIIMCWNLGRCQTGKEKKWYENV